jgi:hypothetical protein
MFSVYVKPNGRFSGTYQRPFCFHKRQGLSWIAKCLSASWVGLYSVELVISLYYLHICINLNMRIYEHYEFIVWRYKLLSYINYIFWIILIDHMLANVTYARSFIFCACKRHEKECAIYFAERKSLSMCVILLLGGEVKKWKITLELKKTEWPVQVILLKAIPLPYLL